MILGAKIKHLKSSIVTWDNSKRCEKSKFKGSHKATTFFTVVSGYKNPELSNLLMLFAG